MQKYVSHSGIEDLPVWFRVAEAGKRVGIAQATKFFHQKARSVENTKMRGHTVIA
jgi:hypothetical protein